MVNGERLPPAEGTSAGPARGLLVVGPPPEDGRDRSTTPGARVLLACFSLLTLVATGDLLVLARHTDALFAWTIQPPISAAFLGAGYGGGFVLSVLSLRSRSWGLAQVAMATVWVFTVLTLVATLLHLDRFHFGADGLVARGAAWFWLAVYLVVPVALGIAVVTQLQPSRRRGARPLPWWLATLLAVEGAVMLVVGIVQLVAPGLAATWWPWMLTPLTSRMIGAWLVAFGVAAGLSLVEGDLIRLRIAAIGYTVFGLLELAALAGYGDAVRWGAPATTLYLAGLVSIVITGAAGWVLATRPDRAIAPEPSR
jgi:hypothetical protein